MKLKHLMFATLLSTLCAGSAFAEPRDGFGFGGGIANHRMSGNSTVAPITPLAYTSSGIGIGFDYQFALGPNFSINPFLLSSGESTSGTLLPGVTAGHGILGLQLRYWVGDMFFGGHFGSYSEMLNDPVTGTTSNASGNGGGLVVGWENPQGGMFITGQYDSATVNYVDASVKLTGYRMSIGYRWK